MKIFHNIKVTNEARDHLLKHYMEPDVNHPSQLRFIPTFDYVLAYKDSAGIVIKDAIVGYILAKTPIEMIKNQIISPFDNGRKFFGNLI